MKRRTVASTLVAASIVTLGANAQAPPTLTLNDALARAVEANRTVAAARTALGVGRAGIPVAGQRPNPEFSVEAERETPHWAFGSTVPIEIAGKRQRRLDVAQAALAVAEAETTRVSVGVRSDVRRAYYQAVAAVRRVDVAQELEAIATRARDAAQERFQTGAAPQLEALQSQLVLAQAQNETTVARGTLAAARVGLNALLAYPADASPMLADPLEAGPLPSMQEAAQLALAQNGDLQVLEKQIAEERARVALARAMRRPDPSVSGTFVYDNKPEFTYGWRFGAAIALPIFTTGRPDVTLAEATLTRTIADRDARAAQITGSVASAVARAVAARQAVLRYQAEILPASLQVEQMADESYRAGQTGLPALLQTVQAARQLRLSAVQAGLDYQLAIADLENAIGAPLK